MNTPEAAGIPLIRADRWLRRHLRRVFVALMLVAGLLRGCAFAEIVNSPLSAVHLYSNLDNRFFHEWAWGIASGDLLSRQTRHPVHDWHVAVAAKHFARHPEALDQPFERLGRRAQYQAAEKLWDGWYGGSRLHQEPLYPYAVAASYALWGAPNPVPFLLLQTLASLGVLALLFFATLRLFGAVAAVLTVTMGMIWGPWILYDAMLLRASLVTSIGMVLLFVADRIGQDRDRSGILRWSCFGLMIGLATALKTTFLLFGVGLCAVALWRQGREGRALRSAVAISAGVLLVLVPIWVRNGLVGAPWFSMTSVGAVTFAGSNVAGVLATGGWYIAPIEDQIAAVMDNSGGSLFRVWQAAVDLHGGLGGWLGLLVEKFLFVWHWYETPNNVDLYFSSMHSTVLWVGRFLVSVVWVLPAALVGMGIALAQRRRVGLWVWYFVCALVPMVVFYVLARFRVPMVVGLLPFAGFGIAQVLDWLLNRRLERAVFVGLVFGALVAWMSRPLVPERPMLTWNAYLSAVNIYYGPRAEPSRLAGDHAGVLRVFEGLLATRPAYLDELGVKRPIESPNELDMVRKVFLPAYAICRGEAQAAGQGGRAAEYERQWRRLTAAAEAAEPRAR